MRIPRRPPNVEKAWQNLTDDEREAVFARFFPPPLQERYLHWDQLRHLPAPEGLTHEQWWLGLHLTRRSRERSVPLEDTRGRQFRFNEPEGVPAALHDITRRMSGSIGIADQVTNAETRNRYLVRNLMEEGITSSQIEGASTTRAIAKEMLRTQRPPRDRSEQMILNNYQAMQFIVNLGRQPLSSELILELHEILTANTLDDPTGVGRLRRSDERIDIVDPRDNEVLHLPPPAEQLAGRMQAMCDFANGKTPDGFVHPVVRSIVLHFWLAYDHPFKDGNGRVARALFYWSMLQHDYWLCQFVSISQIIRRAPIRYVRAFLHTETDDNDLTYFILHQLEVIQKAVDELYAYIDDRVAQRRALESRLRVASELNERQLNLVEHALRHPNARYDIAQHRKAEGVVYQTARTDLLGLVGKGLFTKRKQGRTWYFHAAPDLEALLGELA